MADEFREHPQGATRHAYGLTQFSLFTLDERHAVLSKNSALFTRHITRANTNATHAFFLILPDVPFPTKEFKPRSYFFTTLWRKRCDVMLDVDWDPIHLFYNAQSSRKVGSALHEYTRRDTIHETYVAITALPRRCLQKIQLYPQP